MTKGMSALATQSGLKSLQSHSHYPRILTEVDRKWIDLIHIREVDSSGSNWIICGCGLFSHDNYEPSWNTRAYISIAMAASARRPEQRGDTGFTGRLGSC